MSKKATNQPVEKFTLRGISASVFENKSEDGTVYFKVTVSRSYKDGDQFKSTNVFSRDDLPVVELLSRQAWVSILKRESAPNSQ